MSLHYLLKESKNECFYLGQGHWHDVFPDIIKGGRSNSFRYKEIFKDNKMKKLSYRKYISDTVNRMGGDEKFMVYSTIDVDQILKKIEKWAGDHDIIFTQCMAEHSHVLTGSVNPHDRLGLFNHYLKRVLFRYKRLHGKYRIWKLRRNQRDLSFVIEEAKKSFNRIPNTSNTIILDAISGDGDESQ